MHTFTSTYADRYKQTQAFRHPGAYTCIYTGAHMYVDTVMPTDTWTLTKCTDTDIYW